MSSQVADLVLLRQLALGQDEEEEASEGCKY